MHIFSDPSFLQISSVLLVLIGIAAYLKQYRAIVALIVVYLIYIAVSTTFSIDETMQAEELNISEQSKPDTFAVQSVQQQVQPDTVVLIGMDISKQNDLLEDQTIYQQQQARDTSYSAEIELKPLAIRQIVACSNVISETRSPQGIASSFSDSIRRVYCFTMIENLHLPQPVMHEWSHEGVLISSIPMQIGKSHFWRAWSYQTIVPNKTGKWTVNVRDNTDTILGTVSFTVIPSR